jgi:putative hemolysin
LTQVQLIFQSSYSFPFEVISNRITNLEPLLQPWSDPHTYTAASAEEYCWSAGGGLALLIDLRKCNAYGA